eukprot:gene18975-24254_t
MVTAISNTDGPDAALSPTSEPNSPTAVSSNGKASISMAGRPISYSPVDRRRDLPPQTGLGIGTPCATMSLVERGLPAARGNQAARPE